MEIQIEEDEDSDDGWGLSVPKKEEKKITPISDIKYKPEMKMSPGRLST